MTQLQIEFNKLREQQRSNLVNEAIKQQEADTKTAQVDLQNAELKLKELKAPVEITQMLSQANLNDANTQKSLSQINEILANIELTKQKTGLTQAEKQREQVALTNDVMSLIHRMTGINYPGDTEDQIFDWIGKLLGGAGKVIGGSLIG